jgi:hypothetical protein
VAITLPATAGSRAELLLAYREALTTLLTDATKDVPSGEWEGVPVVTAKDANEALDAVFAQRIPIPPETTAEVHTPATIYVSAICPKCSLPSTITLEVGARLMVENTVSGELQLKAKAKARTHVCGQLSLPDRSDENQQSFELTDIVGDEGGDDAEPEPVEP